MDNFKQYNSNSAISISAATTYRGRKFGSGICEGRGSIAIYTAGDGAGTAAEYAGDGGCGGESNNSLQWYYFSTGMGVNVASCTTWTSKPI